MERAFRRSIWQQDERYKFRSETFFPDLLCKVCRVQSIEAAKKRTPPIPIPSIVRIIEVVEGLPDAADVTAEQFEEALKEMNCYGAGLKTLICIVAVMKHGQYPPLDERIAKAARLKNAVTVAEEHELNGRNRTRMAQIYVSKLLPKWLEELEHESSAEALDNSWGLLANGSR